MNIYEYAMKVEKDGERYYRELADSMDDASLKSILLMLADEEVKHYITFEKMHKHQEVLHYPSNNLLRHTLSMFRKRQHDNPHFYIPKSYIEAFESALRTEKNSYAFYLEKGKMIEDEAQKEAFLQIAEEERQHVILLENLIEFITDPNAWLEHHEPKNLCILEPTINEKM